MAIPTPSFFKIRVVALIIGFAVLCFLVGAVKDAYSADYSTKVCEERFYHVISSACDFNGSIYVSSNPHFTSAGNPTVDNASIYEGGYIKAEFGNFYVDANGNSDGSIYPVLKFSCNTEFEGTEISESANTYLAALMSSDICPDSCSDEKEAKVAECGGEENVDWSEWSDETCSGAVCKNPCDGEGEYTPQDCVNTCNGDIEIYDNQSCSCVCGNCDEELAAKKTECGSLGVDFTQWNNVTCTGPCNEDPCIQATDSCIDQCGGGSNIAEFSCQNGVVTIPCKCMEPPESKPGDPKPDPNDPPPDKDPEPDKPNNPDDPSDQKLGAIHDELQKIVEQNNDRKNQLSTANDSLDWIGKNNKIIADNTDAINKNINGVKDGIDDLNADIDKLTDAVDGTYTAPGEEEKYTSEEHDFGDRTTEFLSQMKTTGVFSLPNKLSDSIPGGGSSTYTISTGATFGGDHTIDFSYLSAGLIILKYIFQIAGMTLAIRIVTLKG